VILFAQPQERRDPSDGAGLVHHLIELYVGWALSVSKSGDGTNDTVVERLAWLVSGALFILRGDCLFQRAALCAGADIAEEAEWGVVYADAWSWAGTSSGEASACDLHHYVSILCTSVYSAGKWGSPYQHSAGARGRRGAIAWMAGVWSGVCAAKSAAATV